MSAFTEAENTFDNVIDATGKFVLPAFRKISFAFFGLMSIKSPTHIKKSPKNIIVHFANMSIIFVCMFFIGTVARRVAGNLYIPSIKELLYGVYTSNIVVFNHTYKIYCTCIDSSNNPFH